MLHYRRDGRTNKKDQGYGVGGGDLRVEFESIRFLLEIQEEMSLDRVMKAVLI